MNTLVNFILLISLICPTIAKTKENNDLRNEILVTNDANGSNFSNSNSTKPLNVDTHLSTTTDIPKPIKLKNEDYEEITWIDINKNEPRKLKAKGQGSGLNRPRLMNAALQYAARQGLDAMIKLYNQTEPELIRTGQLLGTNHPATLLSQFSAPLEGTENTAKAAFAALIATKNFKKSYKQQILDLGRQAPDSRITFRRTPLEGLCPIRDPPICLPAAQRYRTHDGTCNNFRRPRWGSGQMPFNRFLPPQYSDGIDSIRGSIEGGPLNSARFISLVVHGADDGEAPVTLMLVQWGQLIDHDLTSTAQPRSINGSVPRCCGPEDSHPSCFPIKVPKDDPWLAPLKVRCLEFLRSAPAQRRDCILSWREQTNQATSYLDASPVYSSNARTSDGARIFRDGLLLFGRGNPRDDICLRGGISRQCVRAGDARSNEQPGLLALHHIWVAEHNRIAIQLSDLNQHWSDEKVYQEARRIIGAMFQHITYREFLPLVLGREVCKLFDLELLSAGYYRGYDPQTNPTVANAFAAAAFRFGHSLVQGSYMRCDRNHNFLDNNVTLHDEFTSGDLDSAGSLHRLLRGMAVQRAQMRDEFITPELTNHLFQSGSFPFGLDLAAINIQRGRDHGIPPYTSWREPCGLSPINSWEDLEHIVGPGSTKRISHAYRSVHDIDLFVGGIAERPVIGGLVGPTFACIIAQQFSNLRKGDRFWYENHGFESSFTPAQLHSIRRVSLSQILCRAVGGGTFQPHIFIPHDIEGNDRIPCGIGQLAPINLLPWIELEPFLEKLNKPQQHILHESIEFDNNDGHNSTFIDRHDLFDTELKRPIQMNVTKIHNKLDFKQRTPQTDKVNNKLDANKIKLPTKTEPTNPTMISSSTKRTVNNIRILLRQNSEINSTQSTQNTNDTEQIRPQTNDERRIKRDISANEKSNATQPKVYKDESVLGKKKSHEIFITGSKDEQYEIEINIRNANRHKVTPTYNKFNATFDIYENDFDTMSKPFSYATASNRPTYIRSTDFKKFTKPPTIIFIDEQDDFQYHPTVTTTKKPSFPLNQISYNTNNFNSDDRNRNKGIAGSTTINHVDSFDYSNYKRPNTFNSAVNHGEFSSITGTISNSGSISSFNIHSRPPTLQESEFQRKGSTTSRPYNSLSSKSPYYTSNLNLNSQSPFSSRLNSYFSSTSDFNFRRFSTVTKRPYYGTTNNLQYSQYKELDNSDDTPKTKSLSDVYDYDITTYNPITTNVTTEFEDYYNDEDENFGNFDKDGYLRPEHMKIETLQQDFDFDKTLNKTNATEPFDDFVLPVLTETDSKHTNTTNDSNSTIDFVSEPRHSSSDILAVESNDVSKSSIELNTDKPIKTESISSPVAFAPLIVLTRPERPDKWAIFNPLVQEPPLPEQPELKINRIVAKEFPKPLTNLFTEIRRRFKQPSSIISP